MPRRLLLLVALALLFRRGKHAVGRLGLTARPDGGLILGPTHLIQPDTPIENIIALYRAAEALEHE